MISSFLLANFLMDFIILTHFLSLPQSQLSGYFFLHLRPKEVFLRREKKETKQSQTVFWLFVFLGEKFLNTWKLFRGRLLHFGAVLELVWLWYCHSVFIKLHRISYSVFHSADFPTMAQQVCTRASKPLTTNCSAGIKRARKLPHNSFRGIYIFFFLYIF